MFSKHDPVPYIVGGMSMNILVWGERHERREDKVLGTPLGRQEGERQGKKRTIQQFKYCGVGHDEVAMIRVAIQKVLVGL